MEAEEAMNNAVEPIVEITAGETNLSDPYVAGADIYRHLCL